MFHWVLLLNLIFPNNSMTVTDGYAWPLSVLPGDSLQVYLNAEERKANQTIRLYDMEGKEVAAYKANVFPQQAVGDKPWETGFGYKPTLRLVPSKSGDAVAILYPFQPLSSLVP